MFKERPTTWTRARCCWVASFSTIWQQSASKLFVGSSINHTSNIHSTYSILPRDWNQQAHRDHHWSSDPDDGCRAFTNRHRCTGVSFRYIFKKNKAQICIHNNTKHTFIVPNSFIKYLMVSTALSLWKSKDPMNGASIISDNYTKNEIYGFTLLSI